MMLMLSFTYWRRWGRVLPGLAMLGLAGCDIIEFSPNDHRVPEEFTNLTEKNLAKLQARPLPAEAATRYHLLRARATALEAEAAALAEVIADSVARTL